MNGPVDDTYRQNYNDISGNKKNQIGDPEQDLLLMEEQIQEIRKLRSQVGNLQVQIADYQQIVKELSDKVALLEKNI